MLSVVSLISQIAKFHDYRSTYTGLGSILQAEAIANESAKPQPIQS
jgi:hypothetical protein